MMVGRMAQSGVLAMAVMACAACVSGGSGNVPLRPKVRVKPVYPPLAAFRGYQGTATVCFTVTAAGTVTDARLAHFSFGPLLKAAIGRPPGNGSYATARKLLGGAAVKTVRQWVFFPRAEHGRAVPTDNVCQQIQFQDHGVGKAALAQLASKAVHGDPAAETTLGLLFMAGKYEPLDPAKAATWYRRAARQGYAPAEAALGVLYFRHQGVPRDYAKARLWFGKAAKTGNAQGEFGLGVLYMTGSGVRRNATTAASWFRKAAGQGDLLGELALGNLYFSGQGVARDYGEAIAWYRRAAALGLAPAETALGVIYEQGDGVKKSCSRAAYWYVRAAGDGSRPAKKRLAAFADKDNACYTPGL